MAAEPIIQGRDSIGTMAMNTRLVMPSYSCVGTYLGNPKNLQIRSDSWKQTSFAAAAAHQGTSATPRLAISKQTSLGKYRTSGKSCQFLTLCAAVSGDAAVVISVLPPQASLISTVSVISTRKRTRSLSRCLYIVVDDFRKFLTSLRCAR